MKAVLLTKDFDEDIKEKVDIILTPQFYWVKKIDIDIKSLKEAKKIAKNLFDLKDDEYIYDAVRLKNHIFAFAIKKNLEIKIEKRYINSIRLAQVELFDYECINLGNKTLKKVNDILFCFPKLESDCKRIEDILKDIKLSKYRVNLDYVNIDKTTLFYLFSSLLILNLYLFSQGYFFKKELIDIEKKRDFLSQKYNLPTTSYQLNSIFNKLKKEKDRIESIKKSLEIFSKKRVKLEKLEFDSKYFYIEIASKKSLDDKFKEFKILESKVAENKYIAKLKYE